MKKKTMKQLFIIVLLLLVGSQAVQAKRLTIMALKNCTSIKIGRKTLKVGDSFESWQTVYWKNGRQLLLVKDEIGRTSRLTHKGFQKYKVKTPDEYFIAEQALGTRSHGISSNHYTHRDYYLTTERNDTLLFPVMSVTNRDTHVEAVWKDAEMLEIVSPIMLTTDGKFYIVSPLIWKDRKPQDVTLTIRERSIDGSWIDNIYQGLHVVIP